MYMHELRRAYNYTYTYVHVHVHVYKEGVHVHLLHIPVFRYNVLLGPHYIAVTFKLLAI